MRKLFQAFREYIHANPVKRFLVKAATDYRYSSACLKFRLDLPPQRLKARQMAVSFGIAEAMP
jgi:hypothetical protein